MAMAPDILIEDRLREAGWVFGEMERVGPRWQHPRYSNDGYTITQAAFLEWQHQQARAGHAEHHLRELKHKLTVLCLSVGFVACIFAVPYVVGALLN